MTNVCNNICYRYNRANYKKDKETGYCRNCDYGFYLKDIEKYRCPCCHIVVRTHQRNSLKVVDEKIRM